MKLKKYFLMFFTFFSLTVIGYLFTGCSGGKNFSLQNKEYEQTLATLSLTLDVSEIEVKKSEGDKITLSYYDTEQGIYDFVEENGVLKVTRKALEENNKVGLWVRKYYKVILSVPSTYSGEITLQTTSGDVEIKAFPAENVKLNVKTDSGDVEIEDSQFSFLNIECKTAETEIKRINASEVSVVTASGDILTANIDCANYTVKGESADLELKNVSIGQISVFLTSGDTELINVKVGSSVYVSSTNGNISAEGIDASTCTAVSKNGDIYFNNLWIGTSAHLVSEDGDIEAYISDSVAGFTIDAVSENGKNNLKGLTGLGGFKKLVVKNVNGDIDIRFT